MGAGSSALIWYGLCLAFVAFVVVVSTALIFYGQLLEARKRDAVSRGAATLPSKDAGAASEVGASTLDPRSSDR
jgi:hypothetical protein